MKIGNPLDRDTNHGPQNHQAHLQKLVEYCQHGVEEGATLVCGGRQVSRPGQSEHFWLTGVNWRAGSMASGILPHSNRRCLNSTNSMVRLPDLRAYSGCWLWCPRLFGSQPDQVLSGQDEDTRAEI